MIRWAGLAKPASRRSRDRWRRGMCPHAERDADGKCLGFSAHGDDEPCEICKACDEHTMWKGGDGK